jgi:hypothetical protein
VSLGENEESSVLEGQQMFSVLPNTHCVLFSCFLGVK